MTSPFVTHRGSAVQQRRAFRRQVATACFACDTDRRDFGVEVALSAKTDAGREFAARDPTLEEAVTLANLVEQLLRGLPAQARAVVSLSLQGYTPSEIHRELGLSQSTVFRILRRVKRCLPQWRREDEAGD
jgi:DNA-directed RNA polymerase specialized sigma24 family protein